MVASDPSQLKVLNLLEIPSIPAFPCGTAA